MTTETALAVTVQIASLVHLQLALESLHALNSGRMRLLLIAAEVAHAPQPLPHLKRKWAIIVTLGLRAAAASTILVVVTLANHIPWIPLVVLCMTSLHYAWFRLIGGDGSEQMALITIIPIALATGPLYTPNGPPLILSFIGAQCLLAYWTSGIAKLFSKTWRGGRALAGIVATESHGSAAFHGILRRYAWLGTVLTWATIALELTLPIGALFSAQCAIVLMIVGASFHFGCAVVMGLNSFPLAFFATYPGLFFLSQNWQLIIL